MTYLRVPPFNDRFIRSPSSWSPVELPNLDLWFDASVGVTLSSGKVSSWSNKGAKGSACDVSQVTTTKQPTISSSDAAFNGKDAMVFVGSTTVPSSLTGTGYSTSGPYELYMVFKLNNDPPLATNKTGQWAWSATTTSFPGLDGVIGQDALTTGVTTSDNPTLSMSSQARMYHVTNNGLTAGYKHYLDGGLLGVYTATFSFPTGTFRIGGLNTTKGLDGKIAALFGVNGTTSSSNLALLKGYMNARWGLSIV